MSVDYSILVTEEGWRKLQAELESLKLRRDLKTTEYLAMVKIAEPGESDVSLQVHSEITFLTQRITQMEETLSHARPVGPADLQPGLAGVGSQVLVRWDDDSEDSYAIVGPPEIGFRAGSISYQSPVGRALLGSREGARVEVMTPGGPRYLTVVNVS